MKWNPTRALREWLETRFDLEPVVRLLRENLTKPVPAHVNWLFTLGSVLAALLAVQLLTGVLLMFHYKPSALEAFQSVQHITYDVPLGWLIRSAHNWGSHLSGFYIPQFARGFQRFAMGETDDMAMPGVQAEGYDLKEGMRSVPDTPGFGLELKDLYFTRAQRVEGAWVVGAA